MKIMQKITTIFSLILVCGFLPSCASLLEEIDSDWGHASAEEENVDRDDCDTPECGIGPRSETVEASVSPAQRRIKDAIEARDIVLGMSPGEVQRSWGYPKMREVAGRGTQGHERWYYGSRNSLSGERVIIFENGHVAGWYR